MHINKEDKPKVKEEDEGHMQHDSDMQNDSDDKAGSEVNIPQKSKKGTKSADSDKDVEQPRKRRKSKSSDDKTAGESSTRTPFQGQPWTPDQKAYLHSLIKKHGETGNWPLITKEYNEHFGRNTNQLRSYWRNILKKQVDGSGK